MIVLDIETSGLDFNKNGIVSIGALCFENPELKFYEECKLDSEDEINEEAMKVNGFSEEKMRDENKQSQKQLIERFFQWAEDNKNKIIIGQNIGWDFAFLQSKCIKYNIHEKLIKLLGYKGLDTYTIAQIKHLEKRGEFSLKEDGRGNMGLHKVLAFCGIKDHRVKVEVGKGIAKQGTPHNALEDCKLTAECFSRLLNGKNLFPEYAEFEIPEELKK